MAPRHFHPTVVDFGRLLPQVRPQTWALPQARAQEVHHHVRGVTVAAVPATPAETFQASWCRHCRLLAQWQARDPLRGVAAQEREPWPTEFESRETRCVQVAVVPRLASELFACTAIANSTKCRRTVVEEGEEYIGGK